MKALQGKIALVTGASKGIYPYPKTAGESALPSPQRRIIPVKTIEADVRHAIAAGWDPNSRGKQCFISDHWPSSLRRTKNWADAQLDDFQISSPAEAALFYIR